MNAQELLIHLTEGQMKSLFRAARSLPADKLAWKPAPGARSALDQLQEVATALDQFWAIYTERKIDFDEAKFAKWVEDRSKITSLDELERLTNEGTKKLCDFIRTVPDSAWTEPVQLPFPGEFTMADVLAYHYWNASYHEGQINYIGSLLAE